MLTHPSGSFLAIPLVCFCYHYVNSIFCQYYSLREKINLIKRLNWDRQRDRDGHWNNAWEAQPLEKLRNQLRSLAAGFFCSLSWAVIAQNEIRSPHSQLTYSDPIVWSPPVAAVSTTALFVMVLLQAGHVIWFSIFFPFVVTVKIEIRGPYDRLLQLYAARLI
jgi:hypothetical protein